MIIVTATLWPGGNPATAQEILHATINNTTSLGDLGDSYAAHVLARPSLRLGVTGFESDVEVRGHNRPDGLPVLLMSVLAATHGNEGKGLILPASREVAHLSLREATEFERLLRGRT